MTPTAADAFPTAVPDAEEMPIDQLGEPYNGGLDADSDMD